MQVLIIFNRNPYDGTDVTWNGLRLAEKLLNLKPEVRLFLMNDSVDMARDACKPPEGFFDLGKMSKRVLVHYLVIFIAFILCFIIVWMSFSFFLSVLIFILLLIIYLIFLFSFKIINKTDINYIKDIINPSKMVKYIINDGLPK